MVGMSYIQHKKRTRMKNRGLNKTIKMSKKSVESDLCMTEGSNGCCCCSGVGTISASVGYGFYYSEPRFGQ